LLNIKVKETERLPKRTARTNQKTQEEQQGADTKNCQSLTVAVLEQMISSNKPTAAPPQRIINVWNCGAVRGAALGMNRINILISHLVGKRDSNRLVD